MKFLALLITLFSFASFRVYAQTVCNTKPVLPRFSESAYAELFKKMAAAEKEYERDTANADAIIWYGRRKAYLGDYHGAINIFSKGIALHPNDARFYRHRGHRYISLRCLDLAIADLERAALLIKNKADEVEPDGMPNEKNIPTSTLQSNTWYHLGLAYYLKGDFIRAYEAYTQCMHVSNNPDMYVATANWLYITLRKLKKEDDAARLLSTVSADMELIENKDYLRILLLYKQQIDPSALKQELFGTGSSLSNASMGFGLGNYYLLNGDEKEARLIFEKILSGDQWDSFGFIAAEAELKRF